MGGIGIIDIGLGNIDSVARALGHLGYDSSLCGDPQELDNLDKIIFPGVGSFGAASKLLRTTGFKTAIREKVLKEGFPILGICLGMQLLAEHGEEGSGGDGLGLVSGEVKLHRGTNLGVSIPHIGWNDVKHAGGILFKGIPSETAFYFVHSYELIVQGSQSVRVATCDHGVEFVAAIETENVFGVQFHPEKSQEYGLALLKNFIENA